MNDYLTAIAALEMTRNKPRATWTHRPYPRRRKRILAKQIAALVRSVPQRRAEPTLA